MHNHLDPDPQDSAGFADPLGDAVTAFAWTFIVALIAYLIWAYEAGQLPIWR
jgi:hypothetical protein